MFSSGEENKLDLFEPGTLVFFIMAFVSDLCLLGLIGLAIPGVGLAIAMFVLMAHWGFGLIITFYFWGKSHGWLAKGILLLFWILPLPLMLGLILMVISSNRVGAFLVEQVAVQAMVIAGAAFGVGEAVEAADVAATGAEVTAAGVETAGAVAEGAEALGAGAEAGSAAAETGAEVAEGGAGVAEGSAEDVFKNPYENPVGTAAEQLNEPPEEQFHEGEDAEREKKLEEQEQEEPKEQEKPKQESKAAKQVRKVFDIADRTNAPREEKNDEDGKDEDLAEAA